MDNFCLDYAQYCDLRALLEAEEERRDEITSLWLDQSNECGEFYLNRGKTILKKERDAARAQYLKLYRERLAKIKPKELTVEEKERFTRWQLEIEEGETWERRLIIRQWECIARDIVKMFQNCIYHHYKFSYDLQHYTEVRQLTPQELHLIKPVDRHLPHDLLQRLKHKKEVQRVEKQRPFERLIDAEPDVDF